MAAFNALKLPAYDESIVDCLAFRKYIVHIDTYATHLNQEDNADGVTLLMYSAANFQNRKGHAPAPAVDPGAYPNNIARGALENHKRQHKVSDNQKRCAILLANTFEGGLPPRIKALIEVNHSFEHLTLKSKLMHLSPPCHSGRSTSTFSLRKSQSRLLPGYPSRPMSASSSRISLTWPRLVNHWDHWTP